MPSIKSVALLVLALQASLQMLSMRYSRLPSQPQYIPSTAVLTAELLKMVASAAILLIDEFRGGQRAAALLWRDVILDWRGTLHISAPALLYLVQNNLLYIATSNLEAAVCQVMYQLKLFTTAIFTVLILRRSIPPRRWLALALLFIGVAVVVHSKIEPRGLARDAIAAAGRGGVEQKMRSATQRSPALGMAAVLCAAVLSGLAGVWVESIVKRSQHVSVAVRNVQLGVVSLVAGIFSVILIDGKQVVEHGFFSGYTLVTWLVVIQVAAGGLIIGVIHRYADNVAKGFATSLSIVLSSLLSWGSPMLGFQPTRAFVLGAALVATATLLYLVSAPSTGTAARAPDNARTKEGIPPNTSSRLTRRAYGVSLKEKRM